MSAEWSRLARECGLAIDDKGRLEVQCAGDRKHRVRIEETPDFLRIWSVVITRAALKSLDVDEVSFWEQNRYRELVGFKVDANGKLVGEAWLPRNGVSSEEFSFVVSLVAKACDDMEYLLTGRDSE